LYVEWIICYDEILEIFFLPSHHSD
jgi:hypothetical protein